MQRLKPDLLRELPGTSPELFDELDQLARALLVAVTRFQAPTRAPAPGQEQLAAALALRRRLRADLQALLGVETAVLGLPGSASARALLNRIAEAGGTGQYCEQESEAELSGSLSAVLQ